ncbi:type VI secretion system lipoprotein TssJ [Pseudomonas antarctica]|uniref:type VI secretion system lipoprotein TssJ n=1 Tax=Pseudomonas antarctica TaxID=219572 RepID=UPI00387B2BB9
MNTVALKTAALKTIGVLWLVLFLLLSACSSNALTPQQQALSELKWNYADDSIELTLTADKDLNQYDGQPHSLLLVVTQFAQPNAFSAYAGSSQQLSKLLLMPSAPPDLIGLTRLFIEPGQTRTVRLPRLEGAKMVGISAGYAHLDPQRSVKLYRIGVDVTSTGLSSKTWSACPKPLAIHLLLGPDALLRSQQSRLAKPATEQPVEGEISLPGVSQ